MGGDVGGLFKNRDSATCCGQLKGLFGFVVGQKDYGVAITS
jgi:hypothetical protein